LTLSPKPQGGRSQRRRGRVAERARGGGRPGGPESGRAVYSAAAAPGAPGASPRGAAGVCQRRGSLLKKKKS